MSLDGLPHGPEFRFLDDLVSLEPGKHGRARYRIRGDEAFLAGHFPGRPILPGVILVEAIAQLGGVVAQSDPDEAPVDGLLLTGIRAAKVLGAAVPGETLEIEARVEGRLGAMIQVSGSVEVGGRALAKATVMLAGGG